MITYKCQEFWIALSARSYDHTDKEKLRLSYHYFLGSRAYVLPQLQVRRDSHRLVNSQVRQQSVVLHDVARHLSKSPQIPILSVY